MRVIKCDECGTDIPSEEGLELIVAPDGERAYEDFCGARCLEKWLAVRYPSRRLTAADFDQARAPLAEHDCAVTGCVICTPDGGHMPRLSVLPVPDTTAQRITKAEWGTGA